MVRIAKKISNTATVSFYLYDNTVATRINFIFFFSLPLSITTSFSSFPLFFFICLSLILYFSLPCSHELANVLFEQLARWRGLTGPIDVVTIMSLLNSLWFHRNQFIGTIPESIGNLTHLSLVQACHQS